MIKAKKGRTGTTVASNNIDRVDIIDCATLDAALSRRSAAATPRRATARFVAPPSAFQPRAARPPLFSHDA
ncbi:hypothetical protein NECAME_13584 [Necator americanus]|uniref:Uncharacterized protein n=1 Tax=Necator americanus TaxID=51031 RepID=W2SUN0_NECAM|nr:hypothetical protein NECAME_13584 [Necator americanus]ETN73228.1 hypothetical protein NECAME_13584 [Necator americanus]